MTKPKPRPYRVELSRREDGVAIVWATSAGEAARIAWTEDPEWEFTPGSFLGLPKAFMLVGEERIYNGDYGHRSVQERGNRSTDE